MRNLFMVMLIIAVAAPAAFATAQSPDRIIYEGKTYALCTNPMEAYFEKYPDKRPRSEICSTGLWRGYIATFVVKDSRVFLKDIEIEVRGNTEEGKHDTAWRSVINDVVPKGEVLEINWFTGIFVLPHGKLVHCVHMGYASTYSNYILLEVKKGRITGKRTLDHKQYVEFREKQFQAYKKTEAYRKLVVRLKKRGETQEEIDRFLRILIIDYTSRFLDDEASPSKPAKDEKK